MKGKSVCSKSHVVKGIQGNAEKIMLVLLVKKDRQDLAVNTQRIVKWKINYIYFVWVQMEGNYEELETNLLGSESS